MDMKTKEFFLVSAAITLIYALGCLFLFKEPFWGYTSICFGTLISVYPIYWDRQKVKLIAQTQLAEILSEGFPSSHGNSVVTLKFKSVKSELDSIKAGIIPLDYKELAEAVELRISEIIDKQTRTKYKAIHIVDSDQSLGVWGKDFSDYPYLGSYVSAQQKILDNYGSVTRLFLFEPNWLKQNLVDAKKAINRHQTLFSRCAVPVITLCTVLRKDIEPPAGDFSILHEMEVFFWKRGSNPERGLFVDGQYILNSAQTRHYFNLWHSLSENAYQPSELFRLVEQGLI
jgi:hypothetical protein